MEVLLELGAEVLKIRLTHLLLVPLSFGAQPQNHLTVTGATATLTVIGQVDKPNEQGLTPIIMAAAGSQSACVARLAAAGAGAFYLLLQLQ